jgi:hypothetical protein
MQYMMICTGRENSALRDLFQMAWQERDKRPNMKPIVISLEWYDTTTGYLEGARTAHTGLSEDEIGYGVDHFRRRVMLIPVKARDGVYRNVVIHDRFARDKTTHDVAMVDLMGFCPKVAQFKHTDREEDALMALLNQVTTRLKAPVHQPA